jgi:L-alanine-DL-glutamate epimerase-like enolase superfamily enzyme
MSSINWIMNVELSYKRHQLPLTYPFAVANSKKTHAENVFIELKSENAVGYGEAAPSYFFHESPETIEHFFKQIQPDLNHDPLQVDFIMAQSEKAVPGNYAAKAAINMALFDLIGKKLSLPVHKFLGTKNDLPLLTSFTIGIDRLDVIEEKVRAAKNYPILKIKLGTPNDFQIIETIRKITNCRLRVDANEGWTKEEAVEKINWLETQNVELVEQPLPAEDIENMKWIRARVNLPLFADESVKTEKDIDKLTDAFDGINIKLMKCGGITEAMKMIKKAQQLNLKTMIGCFIESSLGITAAAHIAPLFDYIDLDGALLIKTDPFRGVKFINGQFTLPDMPGLGVEPIVL